MVAALGPSTVEFFDSGMYQRCLMETGITFFSHAANQHT